MEMLIGQYRNTLDEKGRILFPAKLRSILQKDELIVTQGLDHCLMLFTTEEWISLNDKIMGAASLFNDQKRLVMRRRKNLNLTVPAAFLFLKIYGNTPP